MAINGGGGNGFPQALINVIEQQNFLETKIRKALLPTLVYRPRIIGALDWFDARIGETKTFTRQALIPPNVTPLNPANNTGLDNGMTADSRTYEQWVATLNEWPGFIPTNIYGQETLIADIYLDNIFAIGQKAGSSIEMICAQRAFTAYDSGDTFLTQATSGAELWIDNGNGFSTQYPSSNLPLLQAPQPISSTNTIPVAIISNTSGLITFVGTANLFTPTTPNASYMNSGGFFFGVSGVLQLTTAPGVGSTGDRVVALDRNAASSANPPTVGLPLNPVWKDGSYVVRPLTSGTSGTMVPTAYAMGPTDIMNPSIMIPYAVSILKRRGIPKLPNGLYGCAIDSTLLASFYGDTGFQRATATNWDRGKYFQDGLIAAGWGVEFTEATQLPTYFSPTQAGQNISLRHAHVFGMEMISEHPFVGARNAENVVAGVGDIADERWVDRIRFRSLAALDTLGQVIKVAYDYIGDFECGTDKASNPTIVLTSDYCRYKRGVILQAASPY